MPVCPLLEPDYCPCCAAKTQAVVVVQSEAWEGVHVLVCDYCGGLGCMLAPGSRLRPLPRRLLYRIREHPKALVIKALQEQITAGHFG